MRRAHRLAFSSERSTSTPIWARSRVIVETSISRGTFDNRSGCSVRSAAHMIGSAAFFAPEMRTSPSRRRPPRIFSLSIYPFSAPKMAFLGRTGGFAPFFGRQRLHRQRVHLFPHALAERRVDELVALHAGAAGEPRRDHQRLEVLAVANHLDVLAGEPGLDRVLDAFGSHHQCLSR